jgi:hypothetical protein
MSTHTAILRFIGKLPTRIFLLLCY